jgi:hypothetical protein
MMKNQSPYIPRKVTWTDKDQDSRVTIEDGEVLQKFHQPLVILGEPGMGKTRLMEKFGASQGCQFIRATSFLRKPDASSFCEKRIVIDGLDEVAAIEEGNPLHNILKKLVEFGKPRFIISSRSSEWHDLTGKLDISDEYNEVPQLLILEPFSEEDAVWALSQHADSDKARITIDQLKRVGLNEFYGNPLTLEFVAAVIKAEGAIPETRSGLYERAVAQLRLEQNPRHTHSELARLSADDALDAAGTAMAAMLITGCDSIATVPEIGGALCLSELSGIGNLNSMRAVLGSRLFHCDSDNHFRPLHRSVAEFLGARWLARAIDKKDYPSRTAKRLLGLISAEGGVPASLRGLHAWLPKFSPERLGPTAIDRDPYGILRYGDGDGLSDTQAQQIINSLKQLAAFDPEFHRDWERDISFKSLVSPNLRNELRTIISNDTEPFLLRLLVLEAINKSPSLAEALQANLEAILFDPNRTYAERSVAGEAICHIEVGNFNWPNTLEQLIKLGDEDSTRLAAHLLDDIGFDELSDELIARVIIAESNILDIKKNKNRQRIIGTFYHLADKFPDNRISKILDVLVETILPILNPEKWWGRGYSEGGSEFSRFCDHLILRQLQYHPTSVSPHQLWDWMRVFERDHKSCRDDREVIAEILKSDKRLRQGIQRLALFEPGSEGKFWLRSYHMSRLSAGLSLTDDDARLYLAEVVKRNNRAEREYWEALVNQFRTNELIPKDIQKIALPYANNDKELIDFLTKKPRRQKLDDWERKHRRNERNRERQREKNIEKAREEFTNHIEEMKRGELRWISDPARAYLGMFIDLKRDSSPSGRIAEWLGEDLRDAALEGFEAVLHRSDLPTATQIAESYAESRVWNFVYPMLAGVGQRILEGRDFSDLSNSLLSALAIAAGHELLDNREQFNGLKEALDSLLRIGTENYEAHLRQQFEPMFKLKRSHTHIPGLYQFTSEDVYRPLSTRLSLEWLQRFSDLPLQNERELVDCIIHAPENERKTTTPDLIKISERRLKDRAQGSDDEIFWRSIQFLLDFENTLSLIPPITMDTREWLWPLTDALYSNFRRHERYIPASLAQLKWIVEKFRSVWPHTRHPEGGWSGSHNPWDATRLLVWAVNQIEKDPSDQAAQALSDLRAMPQDSYTTIIQAAIARQHRIQLEAKFRSPSLPELQAVLSDEEPQSAADIQAIVLDELAELQKRLQGDQLNLVNKFYTDSGKPRTENECRDLMLIGLGNLPFNIQCPPEFAMPQGKRSDGAFVYGKFAVPLEAKGQWNESVWNAAEIQLGRYYSIEYKAENKGIYVVFWFGPDAPKGKKLRRPPKEAPKPSSAEEMRFALQASIPTHLRNDIAVVVLDLTRP